MNNMKVDKLEGFFLTLEKIAIPWDWPAGAETRDVSCR